MKKRENRRYALHSGKFLNPSECSQLWKILDRYKTTHPRDVLLIELGLVTGARASEILEIRVSDINEYDRSLQLIGLKGSNDREIPLKDEVFDRLLAWVSNQGLSGNDKVFSVSYFRFRQIWQDYRPVKKPLHCLRHTFAIELFQKTRDLRLVQLALGHRSINNTMIYADFVYSKQEMRRLITT